MTLVLAAVPLLVLPSASSLAQTAEADGGLRLDAGLNLRLEMDDDVPEFRTSFNLDLISSTRTQRLSFSGDYGLVVPLEEFDSAAFNDPSYGVDYLRDTGESQITLSALFRQSDIDGISLLLDDPTTIFDESDLTEDDGTRETRSASASVELGRDDPLGATLQYSFNEILYSGTNDPSLTDTRRQQVAGTLRFDITQTLQVTANGEMRRTDEDDLLNTTEENNVAGLSANWQIRPDISLDGSLSYTRVTTDTTVLGVTTTSERDGVDVRLGASLDRPNGVYRFDYSRIRNVTGFVDTAELLRSYSLAGGIDLSAGIGAVRLPSGDVVGIGSLGYNRATVRGVFSTSLARTAAVNGDDDAVVRTTARARYAGELSPTSTWSLSGALINSNFQSPTSADLTIAEVSFRYNMELTDDWGLSTGVTYRETREDGAADRDRSTLFLTLDRTFSFRR